MTELHPFSAGTNNKRAPVYSPVTCLFIAADGFDPAGAFGTCHDSGSLVNIERFQFSRLRSEAWILRKRKFQ